MVAPNSGPVVEVEGARELATTLSRAADDLGDLRGVHDRIGRLIASNAVRRAPRRTGRLAGSIKATGTGSDVTVAAGVTYAGIVHYGLPSHNISPNPFLTNPAHDLEPVWTGYYVDEIDSILRRVHGT